MGDRHAIGEFDAPVEPSVGRRASLDQGADRSVLWRGRSTADGAATGAAPRRRRLGLGVAWAVAVVAVLAAVTRDAATKLWWTDAVAMEDLDVYRRAGQAVLDASPVYEPAGSQLVFTYPPPAALAAVPLAPLPQRAAYLLWTAAQVAVLAWLVWISFAPLLRRWSRDRQVAAAGLLTAVALVTVPLNSNLELGQVNVLLAGLVVADLLPRRRRLPQGVLVGLATACKLVPGLFIVYLLAVRRWRAAAVAVTSFLVVNLVAWLVLPDSVGRYWTAELWATERIGSLDYTSNQSVRGMLERVAPLAGRPAVWLLLVAAVTIVGLGRAVLAHRRGDELAAITLVGLVSVLVSPVGWIHHLVWFVPALGLLVGDGRDRRRVGSALVVTALLVVRLPWMAADALAGLGAGTDALLRPPLTAIESTYGLLALACVLVGPVPRRWRPSSTGAARDAPVPMVRPPR